MRRAAVGFKSDGSASASNDPTSTGPDSEEDTSSPFCLPPHFPIFVARQPIFDRAGHIWGYELLFRSCAEATVASFDNPDLATSKIIADGLSLAAGPMEKERKFCINFTHDLLVQDALYALPPEHIVAEVLEDTPPTDEVLKAIRRYKDAGYSFALDDYSGQPELEPFLDLVDIVKMDFMALEHVDLIKTTQTIRQHGQFTLLAEKVATSKSLQLAQALCYDLFQGNRLMRPRLISGRSLPSSKLAKLRLLSKLASQDFEVAELAQLIATDVSLSYRLLRHINSAYYGFARKISSLQQAVSLLGSDALRHWIMAAVLTELEPGPLGKELAFLSVRRARFMELISRCMPKPPGSAESMFLVGLFSMLDILLGTTMEQATSDLPLDEPIKDALLGEDSEYSKWFSLLNALDGGLWDDALETLQQADLAPETAAASHALATTWARQMLELSTEGQAA
ncbi:diguanylate phosphodiesterase [Oceanidesulfovibrio marinus]|uniref:Diguanylate phosphodiesterase n=1 Tax=Oceanidesulfovibrio marinus TaxID=370038 RepID=A0A6P1ZJC7_9BACT|nr:diguanylate phosphodiesterase [Oceanidesulfovibrio marinus]